MKSAKVKLPRKFPAEEDPDIEILPTPVVSKKPPKAPRKRLTDEEKAAKQAAKDLDKALKKSAQEARKNEAPGNAIKFVTIQIPGTVAAKYDGMCAVLTASEIKYEPVSNPILENAITFRRDLQHKAMGDDLQMQSVIRPTEEDNVLLLMYPEEYIPKFADQIQQRENCMITYVQEIQSIFIDKKLTLFFMDFEKYMRKQKKNTQQDFRNRVLNDGYDDPPKNVRKKKKPELPSLSATELQGAIVELQLITSVNYRMIKDAQDLGTQLLQFTKAIADAPYKRKRLEDGFDWYALSDSGNIKVDKDGNGLKALWIDQLMQFNNVGIDTAQAIASKYPAPKLLIQAYSRCGTIEEGLHLLQDIPVRMGIGPLAKTRKVGPELSKKIYRFFTCTTGERSLGSSHDT